MANAHIASGDGRRVLCSCISIFLLLAGVTALTVWLVYRPYKPQFTVMDAAVYSLNATSPFIFTSMQFTIATRNPNKRVSIFYDALTAYVSYRNQPITPLVMLPPLYHEKKSTVVLSPVLGDGEVVSVSAELVNELAMDETYGVVPLTVVLMGRLRWKAGAIKTIRYEIYVRCDVWVGLKNGSVGVVPLLRAPPCKVDI
ncbi:hypothetical protein SLEP1_g24237 [Rubroshorea leprosula]|uniref:Late embryogenesis abundant protein LEA-2 subgroup domain-containing protein n=1 Tax=Rubroshorea leprosula TaxID=152421 RepID=A0AAV5JL93_9ROSI|nr:hypothetical protein SLEP1_g24237 [Rubroshorea leprosula]